MSKRDYIDEILAKKLRSKNEWQTSSIKIYDLRKNFDEIKTNEHLNVSQYSLFLVGIVTCLELATRKAIQSLVDEGSPYIERIDKFKDFLKLDLNVTKALHDKKVTFGELVSHLVPVNNVENIISHLGVLLDFSFTEKLRTLTYPGEPDLSDYINEEDIDSESSDSEEVSQKSPELFVDDVNKLISEIAQIFTKRHIIVHEADFEIVSTAKELESYFDSAGIFINAIDELIEQTINPRNLRHTMHLAVVESFEADKKFEEMEQLLYELTELTSTDESAFFNSSKEALEQSQKKFLSFLESEIDLEASVYTPGTGYFWSYVTSLIKKELCSQRTERLKDLKKIMADEVS